MLSISTVVENIAEVLRQADGIYLEQIHNQICSGKVSYTEDSLFSSGEGDEKAELSFSTVIENITETLLQADGDFIAKTYNSICSDRIRYVGDSMFEAESSPMTEPPALNQNQIAILRSELSRDDLSIYACVRLARKDVEEAGHFDSAILRLRSEADKLRMHDTPLLDLIEYQYPT